MNTWAEDTATQGCDRSAGSAAGILRVSYGCPADLGYSGAKAINPRGMGTESPFHERPFPFIGTEEVVNHRSVEHSWMRHFTPRRSLQ
jgi:hypothetical protein